MGLMKKLTSAIVTASLVVGLVGTTASAAFDAAGVAKAVDRMKAYGLVRGVAMPDGTVDMQLGSDITRAQFVTIIVRAFGMEKDAQALAGLPVFTDTAGHWASGEIAVAYTVAKKNGFPLGTSATTFSPNAKLTTAEAIGLLLKFLGIPSAANAPTWQEGFIQGAFDAGLITADDRAALTAIANSPATRGLTFWLADTSFSSAKLPTSNKTVYQTYVDTQPPVISVSDVQATTTATSVKVTGKVTGATVLHVNIKGETPKVVATDANGNFSTEIPLKIGDNVVWVHALDAANNAATVEKTVTRNPGAPASVEATLSSQMLKAGSSADLKVVVKDANGTELKDAAFEVTVEGAIGTYAGGKLTAATKPATGKVTVTAGGKSASIDVAVVAGDLAKLMIEPATVSLQLGAPQAFTVKGTDASGNEVKVSNVTWTATGGVIDQQGNFAGTKSGAAVVTATSGSLSASATATIYGVATALKLSTPEDIVANGSTKIKVSASVIDAAGNVVPTYTGKVNFALTDNTNFTLGKTSVDAVNGMAEVEITGGNTADRSGILQATASGLTGANATVKTVKQTLTSFTVTQDFSKIPADNTSHVTLTVQAKDQAGVNMVAAQVPTVDVQLSLGGNTSFVFNTTTGGSSTGKLTFAAGTASQQIRVRSNSSTPAAATVSGSVTTTAYTGVSVGSVSVASDVVGSPYKLGVASISEKVVDAAGLTSSDDPWQAVKVFVQDYNGNTVFNAGANTLTLTLKGTGSTGNTITIHDSSKAVDADGSLQFVGTWNGSYTFYVKATKAEKVTYEISGSWGGLDLVKVGAEGSFKAGPANKLTLSGAPKNLAGNVVLPADGISQATVSVKVTDSLGNAVGSGSHEVTLQKLVNNGAIKSLGSSGVKATTANGEASFTVISSVVSGSVTDTLQATATGLNAGTIGVTTAVMGVPAKFGGVSAGSSSPKAGAAFTVKAEVQDVNSAALLANNGQAATVTIKDADGATVYTNTASSVGGLIEFKDVALTKAATGYVIEVSDPNKVLTAATSGLSIVPNSAAKVTVTTDFPVLKADNAGTATIKVSVADAHGNVTALSSSDPKTVTVKLDNSNIGTLADDATNGGFTAYNATTGEATLAAGATSGTLTFTVKNVPGSGAITASATGLESGSVAQAAATVGTANTLAITSVTADVKADGSSKMTIKVEFRDSSGNLDTGYNAATVPITLSVTSGSSVSTSVLTTGGLQVKQGKATFEATSTKAQTATFKVEGTGLAAATASGNFIPGTASTVTASVAPYSIKGDGSSIALVTLKVSDANSNQVSSAAGEMTLNLSDANFAFLQGQAADGTLKVNVANGQASAVVQAKNTTSSQYVGMTAKYTLPGATSESTFTINNALFVWSAADAASPTMTVASTTGTITLTFSEPTNKTTVNTANFTLSGGATFGTGATFTWNDAGDKLTIVLGTGHTITGGTTTIAPATVITDVKGNTVDTTAKTIPTGL